MTDQMKKEKKRETELVDGHLPVRVTTVNAQHLLKQNLTLNQCGYVAVVRKEI